MSDVATIMLFRRSLFKSFPMTQLRREWIIFMVGTSDILMVEKNATIVRVQIGDDDIKLIVSMEFTGTSWTIKPMKYYESNWRNFYYHRQSIQLWHFSQNSWRQYRIENFDFNHQSTVTWEKICLFKNIILLFYYGTQNKKVHPDFESCPGMTRCIFPRVRGVIYEVFSVSTLKVIYWIRNSSWALKMEVKQAFNANSIFFRRALLVDWCRWTSLISDQLNICHRLFKAIVIIDYLL